MSDTIISVENLGKKYVLSHQGGGERGYARFSERLEEWVKRPFGFLAGDRRKEIADRESSASLSPNSHLLSASAKEEFWALKDVSFEVKRGEVVGIIGRNGAGKSTLLKILSRITEPTEGRVTLRGRVASLLEVGTGFHPELTGRENIFLNGAILGMTKAEIRKKFDEIVAFAEVERFLDTPVKRYSSGMYVRLAFAVAAHLEPEILVVDEVLAVGDAEFQKKCLGKMKDVATGGRTVLFVSHNLIAVENLCGTALWLQGGRPAGYGAAREIIHHYQQKTLVIGQVGRLVEAKRKGSGQVRFKGISIQDAAGNATAIIHSGQQTTFILHVENRKKTQSSLIRLNIFDRHNNLVTVINTKHVAFELPSEVGFHTVECRLGRCLFAPGAYRVSLLCHCNNETSDEIEDAFRFEVVPADFYGTGSVPVIQSVFYSIHQWTCVENAGASA